MWFLYMLSWVATVLQICFVTLAIAAGLYYLAELVEEYSVMTAKVIRWMVIITLLTYIGLFLFEDLPPLMVGCGILAQISHLALLSSFPYFAVTSPSFLFAVVMVLVNHYLAFQHFGENYYPFSEVMAYFSICMWLVPFTFFVSLSANENVLPTFAERRPLLSEDNDLVSNYFSKKEKKYGLLSVFNSMKDTLTPAKKSSKSFWFCTICFSAFTRVITVWLSNYHRDIKLSYHFSLLGMQFQLVCCLPANMNQRTTRATTGDL